MGCETIYTQKDLVDGQCPYHPSQEPKLVKEKNYFFSWSKYEDFLKNLISSHPQFIQHTARRNEMLSFLNEGLEDIPISRASVKFGIPVPNDASQVLYVWFDALINYITWNPDARDNKNTIIVNILGKDNVRTHALLWPA